MNEIYQFAKLYFANFFYFGNSPNINPAKHSRYTVYKRNLNYYTFNDYNDAQIEGTCASIEMELELLYTSDLTPSDFLVSKGYLFKRFASLKPPFH